MSRNNAQSRDAIYILQKSEWIILVLFYWFLLIVAEIKLFKNMNKQLKEKQRFFFPEGLKTCDYFEIIWKILTPFFPTKVFN